MPGKGLDRETDPQTTYAANLKRFVHEARAAGAIPILVTPMVRRNFTPEGTVQMELAPWAEATRNVAKDMQVPLVDLNARSAELMKTLGPEKASKIDPEPKEPGRADHTHLSKLGAELIAGLVADELKQAEPDLAKLLK
jgi:lysophospholipase L1-like esterase